MIDENIKENWGKANSQFDTISSITRLHEIEKPTLIILGDMDEKDIFAIGDLYEAEKIIIKDVGHSLNVEKPKVFNEIIINFLKK